MTADERGLLAAVCESPDDDTPRLILADWYEENGQPDRAGFIRAQIELARLVADEEYDTREYLAASRAVSNLPNETFVRWVHASGLPFRTDRPTLDIRAETVLIRDGLYGYTFRRGLVEQIEIPLPRIRAVLPHLVGVPVGKLTMTPGGLLQRFVLTVGLIRKGWRAHVSVWARTPDDRLPPHPRDELVTPTRSELFTELSAYLHRFWLGWCAFHSDSLNDPVFQPAIQAIDAALNPYPLTPRDAP